MYHLYTDYTKFDEFKEWYRKLARFLEASTDIRKMGKQRVKFFSDGLYNYGLREDGTVIRIAKKYAEQPMSLKEPRKETPKKIIK